MSKVLEKTVWQIVAIGSIVEYTIGKETRSMDYQTALAFSQDLRIVAKQAKLNAGDTSRTMRARGLLTDANTEIRTRQNLIDPTASFR